MARKLVTDSPVGLIRVQTMNDGPIDIGTAPDTATAAVGNEAELQVAQGPATILTFQTGAITPVNNGHFLVWGTVSGDASTTSTTEHRLWADGSGVTKIASGKCSTANTAAYTCTLHGYLELDPATTHYFLIESEVTYGGGTISCNSHEMFITWLEI
jgi:hypothetical protein